MTEATVTKVVGAVYCAFATMLSEEGLALMNDTLRFAAVTGSEEEKRILSLIADATKRSRAYSERVAANGADHWQTNTFSVLNSAY